MSTFVELKNSFDDFHVEFSVQSVVDCSHTMDERQQRIAQGIASVNEQLAETQKAIADLNSEIDRLTNHADGLDYVIAVASGVLAGIIDILFVDDFSLEKANEWGNEKTNNFVVKIAQKQGYEGDDLYGAVKYLEDNYPIAADKVTNDFGGGRQHHLRDFSHHPTPVGAFFSLLTQFTHKVYGTDTAGRFLIVELPESAMVLIGKNLPEKITFGIVNWFFHMVSDMAGSSSTILEGKLGTGLPGPFVSLLKELSSLPIFRKQNDKGYKEFSVWISKLFNGTLLGERDENGNLVPLKFDFRTEMGVIHQLKQQALPVVINECIVRGFYFIRHLCIEIKRNNIGSFKELGRINWKNTLPFKNRTIIRMLTISTGTMTAIDLADAAIEAAVKSGGFAPGFVSNMLVKVNFVGLGRFVVAVSSDVSMAKNNEKNRTARIAVMNEYLFLLNCKTFYKQAEMWVAAENAGQTIDEAYAFAQNAVRLYAENFAAMQTDFRKIGKYIPKIEEKNKGLIKDMIDFIEWS